jgi:FAD/FMN-containing dehydrogenase
MTSAHCVCLLAALTISQAASSQEVRKIKTCFEESLAALRLSQLEDGIARCDDVIEDKATAPQRRGETYAQRGLMQARRWSLMSTIVFATQGVGDITEALKLHTPPPARKHQLWLVRARLYAATGQTRRAYDDFTAILGEDPGNAEAISDLARIGSPAGI